MSHTDTINHDQSEPVSFPIVISIAISAISLVIIGLWTSD